MRIGEHAQPPERIFTLEHANALRGNAAPAYAVISVAARDVVAFDLVSHATLAIRHARRFAVPAVQGDVVCLVNARSTRRGARVHQVARDLGLAINRQHRAVRTKVEVCDQGIHIFKRNDVNSLRWDDINLVEVGRHFLNGKPRWGVSIHANTGECIDLGPDFWDAAGQPSKFVNVVKRFVRVQMD